MNRKLPAACWASCSTTVSGAVGSTVASRLRTNRRMSASLAAAPSPEDRSRWRTSPPKPSSSWVTRARSVRVVTRKRTLPGKLPDRARSDTTVGSGPTNASSTPSTRMAKVCSGWASAIARSGSITPWA